MTQISKSDVYDPSGLPPPNNVRGWLMGIHGYQEPQDESNRITDDNFTRRSSVVSEDSVNLDELIKANYTLAVDDETDLPSLANLDLDDDSKDDFWNLDKEISDYTIKENDDEYNNYMNNAHLDSPELTWSPPDVEEIPRIRRTTRSGSINSDISLTNQYTRYGMTPMVYPSDSTSTCSRTPSRLSNYSASSQASSNTTATTGTVKTSLPRPLTTRSKPDEHHHHHQQQHLLPRPTSRLSQRASHIPAPSSKPRLGTLSSSKSTGGTSASRKPTGKQSHIPSVYERSASPIRNSVFGRDSDSTTRGSGDRRPLAKSTGLRPPAHTRSSSRIGVRKL